MQPSSLYTTLLHPEAPGVDVLIAMNRQRAGPRGGTARPLDLAGAVLPQPAVLLQLLLRRRRGRLDDRSEALVLLLALEVFDALGLGRVVGFGDVGTPVCLSRGYDVRVVVGSLVRLEELARARRRRFGRSREGGSPRVHVQQLLLRARRGLAATGVQLVLLAHLLCRRKYENGISWEDFDVILFCCWFK